MSHNQYVHNNLDDFVFPDDNCNSNVNSSENSDIWESVNRDLDFMSINQSATLIDIYPLDIENGRTDRQLNGIDFGSRSGDRSKEHSLLDLDTPFVSTLSEKHDSITNSSIRLLMKSCRAYRFDPRNSRKAPIETEIVAGSLLKPTCELDDDKIISFLCGFASEIQDIFIARDCSLYDTYTVISKRNTGGLTREQTEMFFPMKPAERIELYNDARRLRFVESVRVGSSVHCLREDGSRTPGRLVWRGLKDGHTWFHVEDDSGMSSSGGREPVYVSAAQLYIPQESREDYTYRQPVPTPRVREVPIKRIETGFEPPTKSPQSSFNEDLRSWNGGSFGQQGTTENGNRSDFRRSIPPRSQSAHSGIASHSFSVSDPFRTAGMCVGDHVIWMKEGVPKKAVLKWIGQLKGHSSIYAGVQFDEPIGQGTGLYQQQEIFKAPLGYAGFMLLSVLHREQDFRRDQQNSGNRDDKLDKQAKHASVEYVSDSAPIPPPRKNKDTQYHLGPHAFQNRYNNQSNGTGQRAEEFMIDAYGEGSCVDVWYGGHSRSGVVRWVGDALSITGERIEKSAVVELDADIPYGWRPASDLGVPAVLSMDNATLVPVTALRRDSRFTRDTSALPARPASAHSHIASSSTKADFGSVDSGIQIVPCDPAKGYEELIGRMKGIQGNRNSCYLDATLYTMFVQSTAFDHLLERPCQSSDIPEYEELKRILANEIVYPLRKFHYVRADHMMKLRELLARVLPGVNGLCGEEKDPEEILSHLFAKLFKAKPFLEIRSKDGKIDKTYLCPIVVEHFTGGVATTQHLLERSMREANVSFAVPPNVLILQMPRYGQQKLFDRILPLESIDITPLVHHAAVPCFKCGQLAEAHCPECFLTKRVFLTEISHCLNCFKEVHRSTGEDDHLPRNFYPPVVPVKRPYPIHMSLFGVISIEMSHYVSFVRHSQTNKWLFFDSMADRQGLDDGFNVPAVRECDKMGNWLSLDGWNKLKASEEVLKQGGKGPENDPLVTRIMSDSYICFYALDQCQPSNQGFLSIIKERF